MAIMIKSDEQVQLMREAGRLTEKIHLALEKHVRVGITTGELDDIAVDMFKSHGAKASFKGYKGFPKSICVSVNNEVIHGIPGIRKLKDGDIVSIDIGALINGFHGDAARTYPVGQVTEEAQKLIDVTRQSFFESMAYAKEGHHLHEVSAAVQDYVESFGFSVVKEYVGHGIGKNLHEDPNVPHCRMPNRGPKLTKNMTFCVEPMINIGTHEIEMLPDQWTIVTRDGKYSAHYENTVLITDGEPELLTFSQ